MIEKGIYLFKEELCPMLGISKYQCERRQKDLLTWLTNFFDYELVQGKPLRIKIEEVYGEYVAMPRKVMGERELSSEKKEKYKLYTIASLGTEFKPNSQRKIARDAINEFGYTMYNHTNAEAVAKRYIKEPFNQYGETDNKKVWVWYSSYEKIADDIVEEWRTILSDERISEEEAACAFYRQEQGEDISEQKKYYKIAQERFRDKYKDIAVLVTSWKLKGD